MCFPKLIAHSKTFSKISLRAKLEIGGVGEI
jgi:hypothetical protein